MDLNDAAFDLSNGPVMDECGQELGELLLNLSRAWEQADTSTSNSIAGQLPSLESSLTGNVKPAFGRRLMSAGRRFVSMGQYGQGEWQRIAKAMMKIGKVLSSSPEVDTDEKPKEETKIFKLFDRDLQQQKQSPSLNPKYIGVGFNGYGSTQEFHFKLSTCIIFHHSSMSKVILSFRSLRFISFIITCLHVLRGYPLSLLHSPNPIISNVFTGAFKGLR